MRRSLLVAALLSAGAALLMSAPDAYAAYASHAPVRPLPVASNRPMAAGPSYFVDATAGDDANDGTAAKPWKTLKPSIARLGPGDTLYLRGGTHWAYGEVLLGPERSGKPGSPITIRSYPGEIAIVDFGFREFFEDPAGSWEPYPEGAPGEYRSTKTYDGQYDELCGNFGDSMVPFFRYSFIEDLRSTNEFHRDDLANRNRTPGGIYAGPGVILNNETGRIHIQLRHTTLASRGDANYVGETDPRKLPLVVCRWDDPARFRIHGASYVRVQDLVIRGSERAPVSVDADNVEIEGLHVYGGSPAMQIRGNHLRIAGNKVRGFDAPWHSRFHDKNRSGSGYLVTLSGDDLDIANNEFTDHHDGIYFNDENWVQNVDFHGNLVSNMNDDGLFLSDRREKGVWKIYQNVISGCVQCLAHPGQIGFLGPAAPGSGNYLFRNVFDLRRWTYGGPPNAENPADDGLRDSLLAGDHGGGAWPIYYFYQNTVISRDGANGGWYAFELGNHTRDTTRRVLNNIFIQVAGQPGQKLPPPGDDFEARGNLFWSLDGASTGSRPEDVYDDPRLMKLTASWQDPTDFRLATNSAAIDRGVAIPADWPDPLRALDQKQPDIGALPLGIPEAPPGAPGAALPGAGEGPASRTPDQVDPDDGGNAGGCACVSAGRVPRTREGALVFVVSFASMLWAARRRGFLRRPS